MSKRAKIAKSIRRVLAAPRQQIRQMVSFSPKSLRGGRAAARDLDLEQAWLRVFIGSVALAYASFLVVSGGGRFTPGLTTSVIASGIAAVVGAGMVYWLKRHKSHGVALRYFAILTDISVITVAMAGADEGGVPFVGLYLWVTVGNGFRFGPRFLMVAYWLSLVGFSFLLLFVPYWVQHRAFSVGLLLVLGIVPLYVLVLLTRLTAQKDAAEQLSNAKSRFVANVSHELRTPLSGVYSVYELLVGRKMTPDDRELVGMLGNAVGNLRSSVDAVLLMSKLEAGAEATDKRPFNLLYFIHQLASIVRPQSVAKGLAWKLHVDLAVPATVVGDQNHLGHALGNLLNNAFKFTSHGSVTLRVSPIGNERIRFEVTDTGIGIPLDQQEHLFERFVQVDTSATRRHTGTGLGTSIARDLVELMGGTIGVSSAPGRGSTFWIELPLVTPAVASKSRDHLATKHVLVVGPDNQRRSEVVSRAEALGCMPTAVAPDTVQPDCFDPAEYFAALLVMEASDAATYAESFLSDRTGMICPWLVVASSYSSVQRASMLHSGSAGLVLLEETDESLPLILEGLENRFEQQVAARVRDTASTGVVRPLKIVLADDNKSNQYLVARILRNAGHAVTTTETGGDAFDLMSGGAFDLALLDLNMPDMTGPDVVKLFRAGSVGAEKFPIIIVSADATATARNESIDAGANEFLTKPISSAQLLSTIERVIAGVSSQKPASVALSVVSQATREPEPLRPAATPLVDTDRIVALRRIARGDAKFLDQYTSAAFSELEQALSKLRLSSAGSDERGARDALHIIEGTGASIGAIALVENCKTIRNYLLAPHDPERGSALAELATTYALTKSAVLASFHAVPDKTIGGPHQQR